MKPKKQKLKKKKSDYKRETQSRRNFAELSRAISRIGDSDWNYAGDF